MVENPLESKYAEMLLCAVNAAEYQSNFVAIHAGGARKAGASEAEIIECIICAIPVAGVPAWLAGSQATTSA
jgi:alkylhydroperoxidase/carboxymuconolactone decarboxylase family protein YurZ